MSANPLPGAVFGLYDGDTLLQTRTSGPDGKFSFTLTAPESGTDYYTIREITPPDDYLPLPFTLSVQVYIRWDGEFAAGVFGPNYYNHLWNRNEWAIGNLRDDDGGDPNFGDLEVLKVTGGISADPLTPLANAEFRLVSEAGVVRTAVTGANGLAAFRRLPPGLYTLTEHTPPPGYSGYYYPWQFRVNSDGSVLLLNSPPGNGTAWSYNASAHRLTVDNELLPDFVDLTVLKVQEGGYDDDAFEFEIQIRKLENGRWVYYTGLSQSDVSNGTVTDAATGRVSATLRNGESVTISGIPRAEGWSAAIVEDPSTTLLRARGYSVRHTVNGKDLSYGMRRDTPIERPTLVTYYNYIELPPLKLIKLDSETGAPLAGAVFAVRDASIAGPNNYLKWNADGTLPRTGVSRSNATRFVSDQNGHVDIGNLPIGNYVVEEIAPPPGYKDVGTTIAFTVRWDTLYGTRLEIVVTTVPEPPMVGGRYVVYNVPEGGQTGKLRIYKVVAPPEGTEQELFDFAVQVLQGANTIPIEKADVTISGQPAGSNVTIEGGIARFTLKHGEYAEIANIPLNTDANVTELADDSFGYTVDVAYAAPSGNPSYYPAIQQYHPYSGWGANVPIVNETQAITLRSRELRLWI